MYGSSFWRVTRRPRDLKRRPREAVVMPFPSPEATPPVTKMYFGCLVTSGFHSTRGSETVLGGDRRFHRLGANFFPAEPVEGPQRRDIGSHTRDGHRVPPR